MSKEGEAAKDLSKQLPKAYNKRRYYNKEELELHCTPNDIWVCFFDEIYDLTVLIQENRDSSETEPIIKAAGTDISHWFDPKSKEPRKMISEQGVEEFYCPLGRYLHLDYEKDIMTIPWWKNQSYLIGRLTRHSQQVRIINTLSNTEDLLRVPREETIHEILTRYEEINAHAKSYTWKRNNVPLNMELTLEQNGILDETALYEELEVPQEERYVPAIHIHFNDDLTTK